MKIVRLKDLPFVPAGHEDQDSPGVWVKVLLKRNEIAPGNLQMLNFARMPVGASFRPHYHEDMNEFFLLLKGQAKIRLEEKEAEIQKDEMVFLPMGRVHEMKNIGDEEVEYIVIGISLGQGGKTIVP